MILITAIVGIAMREKSLKGKKKATIVAVGVFDGVHIGHQKILSHVVKKARRLKLVSMVVTFSPHPASLLGIKPAVPLLTSVAHRVRLLKARNIDNCVVLDFNKTISRMKAKDFIGNILVKKFRMNMLVVGEAFSFGSDCLNTSQKLKGLSKELGFKLDIIRCRSIGAGPVSSSIIRKHILQGSLKKAEKLLGRPVSVLGTVVHGRKRGRIIGFKTANIDPHHEAVPPAGVYAV
jgi:riboflavin kinase/FMN adenylyltransferase